MTATMEAPNLIPVDYAPEGSADVLFDCEAPEVLLEGPAGTGKSRAALEKIYVLCEDNPNIRCLIARKTRVSMTESVLVTFEQHVLPPGHPARSGPTRAHRTSYKFPNGSEIVVSGLDNPDDPNKTHARVMSTEYDIIALFEATEFSLDDYEKLLTRLRNNKLPYQQMMCDCNPDAPNHWLNKRATDGGMVRLLSRHEDNPLLWDREANDWTPFGKVYIGKLDRLTGSRRGRLRFGQWVGAHGAVFEEVWDAVVHIVKPLPVDLPRRWHFASVDWGYTNPGVINVWAVDADRRIACVRQIYHCQRTIDWWIAQGKHLKRDLDVKRFVCDPAEPGYIEQFRRAGLSAVESDNDISLGLSRIEERLTVAEDKRPRLTFVEGNLGHYNDAGAWTPGRDESLAEQGHPVCTEEEFTMYAWPKAIDGKPLKEVPIDKYNHGMDTVRYAALMVDRSDLWEAPKPPELPPNSIGKLLGYDKIFGPKPRSGAFSHDRR